MLVNLKYKIRNQRGEKKEGSTKVKIEKEMCNKVLHLVGGFRTKDATSFDKSGIGMVEYVGSRFRRS